MIRKSKALGLALVAVLAMSALVASAAQAAPVTTISAAGESVSVHGTGEKVGEEFTVDGVTTVCEVSHYTGTAVKNSTTITLHPTYTGCVLKGVGINVTVNTEKCNYVFHLTSKSGATYNSKVDITCGAGESIKISSASCAAEVKAQTGLTNVAVTNDASDVTITPNVTGIAATVTTDGFLCPFSGTGAKTGGTYKTTSGITGTAASGSLQISGE
jgi:opacity protein-like surface antigen